jgi:AcrR family transcriptional regulator
MSHRAQIRTITQDEIKTHARAQLRTGGAAAISLTGIARAMGLTTPALYHYFRSRDELLTALIIQAYAELAISLERAVATHANGAFAARLFAAMLAYRTWALANPADFLLIYGTPVPDYHAPLADTSPPAQRTFAVFFNELTAAADAGALTIPPQVATQAAQFELFPYDARRTAIDPAIAALTITSWMRLHGTIILEVVGQLAFLVGNPERFYTELCRTLLAELGLTVPDTS